MDAAVFANEFSDMFGKFSEQLERQHEALLQKIDDLGMGIAGVMGPSPTEAGKDVKKDAEDEEEDEAGNKVKTFLGETIVIIQNDPTSVNMGEEEQTITLQDGSREDGQPPSKCLCSAYVMN